MTIINETYISAYAIMLGRAAVKIQIIRVGKKSVNQVGNAIGTFCGLNQNKLAAYSIHWL